MHFNLLHEDWIPVRTLEADVEEVGILELFERAHELSDLSCELPTERAALLRLLLAFLHRATQGPADVDTWIEFYEAGRFDAAMIKDYADDWTDRFDLFDAKHPFFQLAGLTTGKGIPTDWGHLLVSVRAPFASHTGTALADQTPAEAARWLVHTQAYDAAGVKSGAVGDSKVSAGKAYGQKVGFTGQLSVVTVKGQTLFETLMLNLIPRHIDGVGARVALSSAEDIPAWEKAETYTADAPSAGLEPTGPVDLFTWQSRRIRLATDETGAIVGAFVCGGPKLEHWNTQDVESHALWVFSKNQSDEQKRTIFRSPLIDPSVQAWRGLNALMPSTRQSAQNPTTAVLEWLAAISDEMGWQDRVIGLDVTGAVYSPGAQQSVFAEAVGDHLEIPVGVLGHDDRDLQALVSTVRDWCDQAAYALVRLEGDLCRIVQIDADSRREAVRAQFYAAVDTPVRRWLATVPVDLTISQAREELGEVILRAAQDLGEQIVTVEGSRVWRPRQGIAPMGVVWGRFLSRLEAVQKTIETEQVKDIENNKEDQ